MSFLSPLIVSILLFFLFLLCLVNIHLTRQVYRVVRARLQLPLPRFLERLIQLNLLFPFVALTLLILLFFISPSR